jgi:hypothetical protein
MDLLEDRWWPKTVTLSRPFYLPLSSKWLLREDSSFITIVAGGDDTAYHVDQSCLPFLMLLDLVQQTYLSMANLLEGPQSITFYKGVIFLDSLRQDLMGGLPRRGMDAPPLKRSLPESMQRWICRLILVIPHDPENRKKNAFALQKAYEEIDVFKYGRPLNYSPSLCYSFTMHSTLRLLRLVSG